MKKLLAAFGIGISIFFAGFRYVSAETEKEISCTSWGNVTSIEKACTKAIDFEYSAKKWVKPNTDFDLSGENLEIREEKIEAKTASERSYLKGFLRMDEIKKDINKEAEADKIYSSLEVEKMFIEAAKYFKQAEKLERKPDILNGSILPGPKKDEDGVEYLSSKFLTKFVNGSLFMLFSLGTLILIIGGLMFLFSSGESEMITKAKDTIFWGIIGIVIAVMAYAIVKFVVGLDFGF